YRRVRRRADAEELAQEVFLRLLRVPDPEAIRVPEAYLYTIASNLVKEYSLKLAREGIAVSPEDPPAQEYLAETPSFSEELDREQRVARLREVLAQLSPKCQAVVALRHWQGRSYEEIAGELAISRDMVKKYLTQALVHCRRRMGRLK